MVLFSKSAAVFFSSSGQAAGKILLRNKNNRRVTCGGSLSAASSSSVLASARSFTTSNEDDTNTKKAKVAVIGSGRMGNIRGNILQSNPKFDFRGVVDVNKKGADALAGKYGVNSYSSLSELLQENDDDKSSSILDGIIISTPTSTHSSLIQEAASYGIHVFTEKPVGESAEEIESLFDVANKSQIVLACGFQRRFDDSYVAATNAVHNQQIGNPISATIFFADHPAPPKEFMLEGGGDIFLDLCAHDVDYITHAIGDDITSVYATGTSLDPELKQAGIHDNAVMVMNFGKSGAVATLFMSRFASYGYDQRCEIFGTEGKVGVENPMETTTILSNVHGIQHSRLQHSFPERFQQAFANELDTFANLLLERKNNNKMMIDNNDISSTGWPITAEQCIKVQKVADAARQSCLEGRLVTIEY